MLVGIPCNGQCFLTWISLHGSKLLICSAVHGSKFSLGVRSMSVGQSLFPLCLWQCGRPLMPEAFFDGVQDFLANVFFHPLFAATPPRQPPQLIYISVEFCYLLLGGGRADQLHGSRFCPQVSFCWWFPSARQIARLCSLQPVAVAWRNICWYRICGEAHQVPTVNVHQVNC